MKIDLISDTHNKHKEFALKGGDLLIHSGDATGRGQSREIHAFLQWFQKQPYKHKIFVPGNHDSGFEREPARYRDECSKRNIKLLIDEAIEIEGIKIYGSPYTPTFLNWYFMRERGEKIKRHWNAIPDDTQILITHGPAYQIRDHVQNNFSPNGENVGCMDLRIRLEQLKNLKLHVYGHIHGESGVSHIGHYLSVNASVLNEEYKKTFKPKKIIVENGQFNIETD